MVWLYFCLVWAVEPEAAAPAALEGGGTTGSFSNTNLKGNYAYEIVGIDITDNAPFREAGVFVADGSGNITGEKTISPKEAQSYLIWWRTRVLQRFQRRNGCP